MNHNKPFKPFDPWQGVSITAIHRRTANTMFTPMDYYSFTVANHTMYELKQTIGHNFYCTISPTKNTRTPSKSSASFMINPVYTRPDEIYHVVQREVELSVTINRVTYTKTFQLIYK